jgi:hypothetical protein
MRKAVKRLGCSAMSGMERSMAVAAAARARRARRARCGSVMSISEAGISDMPAMSPELGNEAP